MRAMQQSGGATHGNEMDQYKKQVQQMQHAIRVRRSQNVVSKPTYHAPKTVYHAPKPVYHAPKPKVVAAKPKATVTPAPVQTATPAPATPDTSYQDKINAMYDQRLQSRIDAFKANRDAAIAGINGQIDATHQGFYDKRNQADVVANQNAQKLREVMSANGLGASGENVTANVGLNAARQGALNQLNTAEGQQVGALNQKIADINNPDRLNALRAQIESERSAALAGAIQQSQDQAWRQYTYNNMSASDKAHLAQDAAQFGQDMAWKNYALKYQGNLQLAQNQAAINAYSGFNSSSGGGDYQSNLAQAVKRAGIPQNQLGAFNWIIQHESSFNPNAKNPNSSAYGYGQFLDSTRRNYERKTGLSYNDPVNQLIMAYQYMNDRYGSPAKAMLFRKQHGWY